MNVMILDCYDSKVYLKIRSPTDPTEIQMVHQSCTRFLTRILFPAGFTNLVLRILILKKKLKSVSRTRISKLSWIFRFDCRILRYAIHWKFTTYCSRSNAKRKIRSSCWGPGVWDLKTGKRKNFKLELNLGVRGSWKGGIADVNWWVVSSLGF